MLNTRVIFFLSLFAFGYLLFVLPASFIPPELGGTILTITTFLFGIIAGFYIVVTTTDYNSIKNILAIETASWISLHQNMAIFNPAKASEVSDLIDIYIQRNFDYEIIDCAKKTGEEFNRIISLVRSLPENRERDWVHDNVRELANRLIETRQQLIVLGTKTLSAFQWFVLHTLAGLVVLSLYGLRTGEIFFDVVTIAISSSIVLILLLIRDLDLYIWNERTFGFDIYENVLKELGHLPYYPSETLDNGRVHPQEKEYRVGIVIDRNSRKRKIEIRRSA